MSDTNKSQFKQTLLTVLILLLFLLVSIQAWYMFEIKKQLDVLHKQQSSLQLQAQGIVASEKEMPEKNHTEASNTEELADVQQSSLQGSQNAQPVQPQEKSLSPDNTQPLIHNEPSDTTFAGQAWDPYREIEHMQRDMDRVFNRRFNHFNTHPGFNNPSFNNPDINRPGFQRHFKQSLSTPEIDVKENADQYIVFVNLPGADESDISVTLDGQRLKIKGKHDYKKQGRDARGNVLFQERRSGRFQRSITLANPVNQKEMKTRLDNGVLTIIIPKVKNGQWKPGR